MVKNDEHTTTMYYLYLFNLFWATFKLKGTYYENNTCRRSLGGIPEEEKWRRKGLFFWSWAAGLPPSSLRRQLRRVYSGSSPAAEASAAVRQLSSRSTIPSSSMSWFNMDFRVSWPKFLFPQFFSTMAKITPTTSLYLLWKYQGRQTQSLWFIISSEAHIAFGRDIRYNII